MAKLEGVKTLDMIGGQITKVEYDGAIYERDRAFDGSTDIGNLLLCTDAPFTWFTKGAFYEVEFDTSAPVVDNVGSTPIIFNTKFDIFRKVSESSTPTIEQVDAKVDALAERVTKLEGEKKDESTPKTVKRKARVGERILITETVGSGGEYSIGDIRTVKRVLDEGVFVEEQGIGLFHSEYEVIAPTFSEGDRVKVLAYGEDRDIKVGEIGTVEDIHDDEDDPYTIGVESDEGNYDYFRPEDIELVEEEPYKPSEGDIVVITGNTNRSRNAVGDIGKVGEVAPDNTARVHVPSRPNSDKVNDNWTKFSEMRPATDEEKAEYERAVKFAKLGRKPGEFKKGDIVRVTDSPAALPVGTIFEVERVDKDYGSVYDSSPRQYVYMLPEEQLELIAPVESRVDIVD